jgi:hypothetical protein
MAHDLLRAAASLTSRAHPALAGRRCAARFIHLATRFVRHARGLELPLPRNWRWASWWMAPVRRNPQPTAARLTGATRRREHHARRPPRPPPSPTKAIQDEPDNP